MSDAFITYSHDSTEHKKKVRDLADRLNRDGVDTSLDQYSQAPPQGWMRWMMEGTEKNDHLVVVCTEGYLARVNGKAMTGKGGKLEAKLVLQDYYDKGTRSSRIVPVVFDPKDEQYIPPVFRDLTHYRLYNKEGYEDLYRHLTKQPLYSKPPLGARKKLPISINLESQNVESESQLAIETGRKEHVIILDYDFEAYTDEEQEHLLDAMKSMLKIKRPLLVKQRKPGSVRLTVELTDREASEFRKLIEAGKFKDYKVVSITSGKAENISSPASSALIEGEEAVRNRKRKVGVKIDFPTQTYGYIRPQPSHRHPKKGGKFEVKKAKNGKFYFNLKAGNGEIILSSQMYADKRGCKNGIESVRKNSASEGQFEAKKDKNGNPFFVLKAKNKEVIGKSESYSSKSSMKKGIASVMRNGPESRVVEVE